MVNFWLEITAMHISSFYNILTKWGSHFYYLFIYLFILFTLQLQTLTPFLPVQQSQHWKDLPSPSTNPLDTSSLIRSRFILSHCTDKVVQLEERNPKASIGVWGQRQHPLYLLGDMHEEQAAYLLHRCTYPSLKFYLGPIVLSNFMTTWHKLKSFEEETSTEKMHTPDNRLKFKSGSFFFLTLLAPK